MDARTAASAMARAVASLRSLGAANTTSARHVAS
jgi:hypothetical protein